MTPGKNEELFLPWDSVTCLRKSVSEWVLEAGFLGWHVIDQTRPEQFFSGGQDTAFTMGVGCCTDNGLVWTPCASGKVGLFAGYVCDRAALWDVMLQVPHSLDGGWSHWGLLKTVTLCNCCCTNSINGQLLENGNVYQRTTTLLQCCVLILLSLLKRLGLLSFGIMMVEPLIWPRGTLLTF